jgi:hypothetical protein
MAFLGIGTDLVVRSTRWQDNRIFCEAAFLTFAWFWSALLRIYPAT